MTTYTQKQLQDMSVTQLERLAGELRHQIQTLAFQSSLGELKTHHLLRQNRRTLARVLTNLAARKNAPASEPKA